MNIFKYVELAKALKPEKHEMRCFHVSFAVYKQKIVSIGINNKKTNPLNLRNRKRNSNGIDYSDTKASCSELICLKKVKNTTNIDFKKISLVNIRVDRNGEICNSKPCESCQKLIDFLGIKKVSWSK